MGMQVAVYGARWLLALLLLEVVTHTLYFNAVARFGLSSWRAAAHNTTQVAASNVPTITPHLIGLTGWCLFTAFPSIIVDSERPQSTTSVIFHDAV